MESPITKIYRKKWKKSEEQSQNQDEIVSHESNSKIVLSTQFLFAIEAFLPAIEVFFPAIEAFFPPIETFLPAIKESLFFSAQE